MVDGHGKDERGEDFKGIYQDTLSSFWQEFCYLQARRKGEGAFNKARFSGRHLDCCWTHYCQRLRRSGVFSSDVKQSICDQYCMFGEKAVSDDMLLHSFKQYLSKRKEQVVCEGLGQPVEDWDNDDKDDEDLLELLDRFGCRSLPTKENIDSLILEVAHKEIIQKVQYVADCWHAIFRGSLTEG